MKTNILIKTTALCLLLFEGTPSMAKSLTNILEQYCVPKAGEPQYCSNAFAAKYNEAKNSCICKNTTYMQYNSTNRHCEIKCPAGLISKMVTTCTGGYYQMMIVDHS